MCAMMLIYFQPTISILQFSKPLKFKYMEMKLFFFWGGAFHFESHFCLKETSPILVMFILSARFYTYMNECYS